MLFKLMTFSTRTYLGFITDLSN